MKMEKEQKQEFARFFSISFYYLFYHRKKIQNSKANKQNETKQKAYIQPQQQQQKEKK